MTQLKEDTILFSGNYLDPIKEEEEIRDLGITMDSLCSFKPQRAKAIKKTSHKAGWILRTFQTRDMNVLRTLWRTLVLPHQDYGSQLWSPVGYVGDLMAQEAPQRAFTRRIKGLRNVPYWRRLKLARLLSSERHQERYKLIYMFKIIRNLVPIKGFSVISEPRKGRLLAISPLSGSRMAIMSLRERLLQVKGPRLWNSLPAEIRDLNVSPECFKIHLDQYLQEIPDQPRIEGGDLPWAQD